MRQDKQSSPQWLHLNSCSTLCHCFCCTWPWKVLFAFLAALSLLKLSPACLFFFTSKYLIQHRNRSIDDATALPWRMRWKGLQTVGSGLLLPLSRRDGTPASLLESMVNGLK